jgi:DNA-directed RNA polymerase I, II, and III subunit RPABC2
MSKHLEDDDTKLAEMDDEEEDDLEEEEEDEPVTRHTSSKSARRIMLSGAEDEEDDEDHEEDDDLGDDDDKDDDEDLDINAASSALPGNSETIPGMNFAFDDMDEDQEEDDEDDERYLQKFQEGMKQNIIQKHHPVMLVQNSDEIEVLTKVIRDANGRVIDPLHQTLPFVTKYEKARILGERARQINSGSEPFVPVEPGVIDGYLIAVREFEEKKIPFILKRPVSGNHVEYWKLADLEIL